MIRYSGPSLALSALLSVVVSFSTPAHAILRHPDGYENATGVPAGTAQISDWFAKYSTSANAIAVGPNMVLTTRHQGGDAGTSITFPSGINAGTYSQVSEITFGSTVDLRLITISGTLKSWASLYTGSVVGQTAVLGGFGPQRNDIEISSSNKLRGYGWGPTKGNDNSLLLGQQRIDSTQTSANWPGTPLLRADFDGPEKPPATYTGVATALTDKVDFEAEVTDGDSGGGWFINVNGTPQLVGLTHAAALFQVDGAPDGPLSSYPGGLGNPVAQFGGMIQAVNLTSFAPQINALLPEPASLSGIAIGGALLLRRKRSR